MKKLQFMWTIFTIIIIGIEVYAATYTETYETSPGGTGYAAILASPNGLKYDTYDSRAFRRLASYPVIVVGQGDENFYWGNNGILPLPLYGEPGTSYCDDNPTNYLLNGYGTGYYMDSPDFILGINFTNGPTHVYGASIGYASGSNAPTHRIEIFGFNSGVEAWSVGINVSYGILANLTIPPTYDPVDRIEIIRNNNITELFGHLPIAWYTIDNLAYEISGEPTGGYEWKYYTEADYRYFNYFDEESLPVRLTYFVAVPGNGITTLHWITESEVDNIGFELFRSEKVGANYQRISSYEFNDALKGTGNSSSRHEYQYIDFRLTNGVTYYYKLVDVDIHGNRQTHGPVSASPHPLEKSTDKLPTEFALGQNYPNPFNPSTTIQFEVPLFDELSDGATPVDLKVYDVLGYEVKTLLSENLDTGKYSVQWDGKDNSGNVVPSGVYLYQIRTPDFIESKKMLFTK